jgi:ABC-2 type transport system ATP-binding protein
MEVENLLTDVMFIEQGQIVLDTPVEQLGERFAQLIVKPDQLGAARAFKPFSERTVLGRTALFFEHAPREDLARLGELGTPSIADLFVARMQEAA